jgi:hypothetical protein
MLGFWVGERVCRCAATVPEFHRVRTGRKTENLKNWISDIQITGPTRQDFRISGFHRPPGCTVPGVRVQF